LRKNINEQVKVLKGLNFVFGFPLKIILFLVDFIQMSKKVAHSFEEDKIVADSRRNHQNQCPLDRLLSIEKTCQIKQNLRGLKCHRMKRSI
jgi:hypothetical protein